MLEVILYLDLETQVGDTVLLSILRNDEPLELPLVLGDRPDSVFSEGMAP